MNHIGFPLPSEMFAPVPPRDEEWEKHVAITKLLDIPLKCPHCKKTLKEKPLEKKS
jgi:hypothetical protein